jgi:Tfp pilus assembly protein PilX
MITTANTPNTATDHPPPCGRRGVALIIVLGLLGLLLISAVSFAVLMRTERNAATNYRHTSSARQMLHAGLARAIEDMNADIGDDLCPAWTNRTFISGSDTNPYPENIFFSRYTGSDPVPARLLTKDVMTYIPVLYHRRLTENIYAPPEWIPITYSNSVIGRYAYAVIDTSGLLDANLVFTSTSNRWLGTSPGEIRLDPAILSRKDLINETTFREDRDNAGRYETVSELASLNSGINYSNLANFEVFSRYSTNAVAGVTNFNLFGLTTTQLADTAVRTAIIQAFTDSGCTSTPPLVVAGPTFSRPNILCAALADYLDSDSVMSSLPGVLPQFNRPITEKLPMLTCFGVAMTYTSVPVGTNTMHTITYKPIINFAGWPVTDSTANDFPLSFRGALCFINQAPAGSLAAMVSPSGSASNNICKSATASLTSAPIIGAEQALFFSPYTVSFTTNSPTIPLPQFDIYVCTEVYNQPGTRCTYFPADKAFPPQLSSLPASTYVPAANTWARFRVSIDGALTSSSPTIWASGKTVTFWAECVDPRFAYSAAPGAWQWRSYSTNNTPPVPSSFIGRLDLITGVTNLLSSKRYERATATTPPYVATTPLYVSLLTNATLAKAAGLSSNQMDGCYDIAGSGIQYDDRTAQLKMHVANAPLKTAGELGYLLCGPWETVRLYDHFPYDATSNDYHRVLDSFEMRDPSVVPVGKVNLKNAPVDVLALLYLGMPLRSEKAYLASWNSAGTDAARPLTLTVTTPALPAPLATNLYNGLRANGPVRGLSALANVYSAGSTSAELLKDYLLLIGAPPFGSYPNVGEFEREAVIRNIAGLLTVKQQMFTIILRADAFTTRFGSDKLKDGTVLSSAIAIAQVYREAAPPHKITVRLLKILE